MYLVNPVAYATVRTGRLIAIPVEIENVHPSKWDWFQGRMDYDHLMKVWDKKNPRKIIVQFTPNHFKNEKKGGLRVMVVSHSVYLKNIYKLFFEDNETKRRFQISNYESVLDYF